MDGRSLVLRELGFEHHLLDCFLRLPGCTLRGKHLPWLASLQPGTYSIRQWNPVFRPDVLSVICK